MDKNFPPAGDEWCGIEFGSEFEALAPQSSSLGGREVGDQILDYAACLHHSHLEALFMDSVGASAFSHLNLLAKKISAGPCTKALSDLSLSFWQSKVWDELSTISWKPLPPPADPARAQQVSSESYKRYTRKRDSDFALVKLSLDGTIIGWYWKESRLMPCPTSDITDRNVTNSDRVTCKTEVAYFPLAKLAEHVRGLTCSNELKEQIGSMASSALRVRGLVDPI